MKILLVAVQSIDGKITKRDNPHQHSWASKEDQEFFYDLISKSNLIVMGRKTYEAAKDHIRLKEGKLRVVLTSSPQKYKDKEVMGQLEFVNMSPEELVEMLKNRNFKELLLVGGGDINTIFLEKGLVDEMYITLEPQLFGKGKAIASITKDLDIALISHKKLNKRGTLLLHYKINN